MRAGGWWYYFPVALFFKTPIPFLILAVAGLRWHGREIPLHSRGDSRHRDDQRINLGIRHVLPIYAPLSILAAVAFRASWLSVLLVAWLVLGSVFAHPDYLPWFNASRGQIRTGS